MHLQLDVRHRIVLVMLGVHKDSSDFQYLHLERRGAIVIVTLDRPPVNAVSQAMYAEIRELFSRTDEYLPEVSCLILNGRGKHFCAGNDLDEFMTLTSTNSAGRMKLVREAFSAIYDCPVPVIASVHGYALGTGVALVGSCDLVICGEGAYFGTPEVGVGVMGGAKHLSRLVPQQMVRSMYFTADPVAASELQKYGGISQIVADKDLTEAALGLASRIARHSKSSLRKAKISLNAIEYMDLKAGYEFEQRLTGELASSPDSIESRRAITERRPPRFDGEGA
jgi:enoyl-CoA hydratase